MACINATARPATVPTCHRQLKELAFVDSSSSLVEFSLFPGPLVQWKLNCTRNALVLPGELRAAPKEYFPDAKFYKVGAILRPWRIREALIKMGIRGITVSDVRGFGSEFSEDEFLAKAKMEIVVSNEQVEAVIDKIIEEARTGEIGDGIIFCERGDKGERMSGGRADMFSTSHHLQVVDPSVKL
ncbi:hypothetical protein ACJRO7_030283 [Eucalyptus globulus]|uniref:Uncharacterized protein n=1 Tax=Eucalyptus globulus TaxID=34317 RepID=A0ABD3JDK8_EUCGL